MPKTTALDNSINFYAPGSDEHGPRFKPGVRGRRPGVWLLEERVGAYARTERGGRFL